MIYFAPEATEAYRRAGVAEDRDGYFASRAAAMGEPPAELVISTFFNFHPDLVRSAIPRAWRSTRSEELVDVRLVAARAALVRMLGDAAQGDHVVEAADLARRAALEACEFLEGRPLFAAHASLSWPDDPLLTLWHAQSLLREFRGDGHIVALVAEGLSGVEALVTHAASGEVPAAVLKASRQWSDDEWAAAAQRLVDRGWLTPDLEFTEVGRDRRQRIEDRTDDLGLAPYRELGDEGCERLRQLTRPLSKAIVAAGGLGMMRS